jgi:anti-anti-sigma factor
VSRIKGVLLLLTPARGGAESARGEVLAALRGELAADTVGALRDRVFPLLDPTPERLVLDVSCLTAVGRPGLRTLVALRRKCASAGVHFVLRAPSTTVRRRLQAGHLTSFFEIEG